MRPGANWDVDNPVVSSVVGYITSEKEHPISAPAVGRARALVPAQLVQTNVTVRLRVCEAEQNAQGTYCSLDESPKAGAT